jgi:hypothetical protein
VASATLARARPGFAAYPSIVLGNPTATVSILHVRLELPFTVSPFTGFATHLDLPVDFPGSVGEIGTNPTARLARLAEGAVRSELVSASPDFPVRQGKYREFSDLRIKYA